MIPNIAALFSAVFIHRTMEKEEWEQQDLFYKQFVNFTKEKLQHLAQVRQALVSID
ncbi:hypothetical protein QUF79_16115 [Fictibacillus enclensis]|nr:hypothetical protein [Fictibacillus enclensis]